MKDLEGTIIVAAILVFILLATVSTALCSSVGVKNGDWIEYDFQQTSPTDLTERIEFTGISGTMLTLNITDINPGTDTTPSSVVSNQIVNIDLSTTQDRGLTPSGLVSTRAIIIPNDTRVGDSVYLGDFGNETILGEAIGNYAGVDRTVLYANFTFQMGDMLPSQYTLNWDKQSGVLVEATRSYGPLIWSLSTVDTSMWTGGIGLWFWVLIVVVIAGGILSTKRKAIRKLWRKPDAAVTDKTPAK